MESGGRFERANLHTGTPKIFIFFPWINTSYSDSVTPFSRLNIRINGFLIFAYLVTANLAWSLGFIHSSAVKMPAIKRQSTTHTRASQASSDAGGHVFPEARAILHIMFPYHMYIMHFSLAFLYTRHTLSLSDDAYFPFVIKIVRNGSHPKPAQTVFESHAIAH